MSISNSIVDSYFTLLVIVYEKYETSVVTLMVEPMCLYIQLHKKIIYNICMV